MTHHPLPTSRPAPRPAPGTPNRRRVLALAVVVSAVVHLMLGGVVVFALQDHDAWTAPPAPQARPAAVTDTDLAPLYAALNEALADQDREAFMSHVIGAAVDPLTLWWDNMDALGWTTAAISPADDEALSTTATGGEIAVVLGSDLGYAQTLTGEGRRAGGGDLLTLGSLYVAAVDITAAGPVISWWSPWGEPRPWDEELLSVAKEEGIVVAGLPGEEDLLAEVARVGAPMSTWVRDDYAATHGREAPLDGFVVFATEDEDPFMRWFSGVEGETLAWDPTGFAFAGFLPQGNTPGLDPELATGVLPTGGLVAIGPLAVETEELDLVLVHEFAHVLQFVDNPTWSTSPPLVTVEGWATYQELAFLTGGSYPTSGPYAVYLAECTAGEPPTIPTDDDLTGEDAGCAYSIASTIFAFAETQGIAPVELADVGTFHGLTPFGAAQRLGTPLSGEAWSAWFAETYR
ncbi:hypothetical protein J4G33_15420 [Actinotalea sp. BY-33]|uniref:Uncharacterized protein n=1 Tax=Actinotalea soli TaxID=2819234 RepID=A0A939LRI0_9CELL|nr:hypothetical protein [Actinotalea soli]MBO1753196.1 hypothetical protein [Actinotalea soli]